MSSEWGLLSFRRPYHIRLSPLVPLRKYFLALAQWCRQEANAVYSSSWLFVCLHCQIKCTGWSGLLTMPWWSDTRLLWLQFRSYARCPICHAIFAQFPPVLAELGRLRNKPDLSQWNLYLILARCLRRSPPSHGHRGVVGGNDIPCALRARSRPGCTGHKYRYYKLENIADRQTDRPPSRLRVSEDYISCLVHFFINPFREWEHASSVTRRRRMVAAMASHISHFYPLRST